MWTGHSFNIVVWFDRISFAIREHSPLALNIILCVVIHSNVWLYWYFKLWGCLDVHHTMIYIYTETIMVDTGTKHSQAKAHTYHTMPWICSCHSSVHAHTDRRTFLIGFRLLHNKEHEITNKQWSVRKVALRRLYEYRDMRVPTSLRFGVSSDPRLPHNIWPARHFCIRLSRRPG